jgi:hypothetical protein
MECGAEVIAIIIYSLLSTLKRRAAKQKLREI